MQLALTDPEYTQPARRPALDRLLLRFIRDERDLPFLHLMLSASAVLFPATVVMFLPGMFRWWMAPLYWAVLLGLFLDRFILMLHNTSHRALFRKPYRLLNQYIPWVLGPFFGETPETYYSHHMGMHHAENNMYDDLSSTLRYQRDRLDHFAHYFFRFFTIGVVELSMYFARRRRWSLMWRAVLGELSYFAVVGTLLWLNWQAALTVFVVPFFFTRFAMMAGNWSQHAFIDASDPANHYRNSITCINTRYNRRCFNDGYHIGHHVRANRHWTEMPADFRNNAERYAREGAVVFEGVDYFQIWMLLMTRQHRRLASHMVDLGEPRTLDQKEAIIRERIRPVLPRPSTDTTPALQPA
jgi:hypothetical protein